jgi:cleavage stimulation factor subunit 3
LIKGLKVRETQELARLKESALLDASISAIIDKAEDDDEDAEIGDKEAKELAKANQLKAIQQGFAIQVQLLSRTISFAWIGLMRAMRRVQGKGAVRDAVGGSRQIFSDARARGKITSNVYVASALIEHYVYKDAAGTKIFERGAKLFPEDESFILEYLKHLLSIGDTTNARVAFETAVSRLTQKPELVSKAKPLYAYFHKYEAQYGELSQIRKLEQRMAELFPEDPKLLRFAARYSGDGFDPMAVRPIVSPATQMRPKAIIQSIEQPASIQNSPRPQYRQEVSPRPQYLQTTNSPKRPFVGDDSEKDLNRPRKLARGESPLKGAAGRRLDQQKRLQQTQGTPTWQSNGPAPFVIPRDITFLLSIIPRADLYTATKFNAEAMVRLLSQTPVPDYGTGKAAQDQPVRYDGMISTHSSSGSSSRQSAGDYGANSSQNYWSTSDGRHFENPFASASSSNAVRGGDPFSRPYSLQSHVFPVECSRSGSGAQRRRSLGNRKWEPLGSSLL